MDSVNSNMIGNLISSVATEKLNLDSRYSVLITTMISSALISANISYIYQLTAAINWIHVIGLLLIVGIVYIFTTQLKVRNSSYIYIKTYKWRDASVMRFMMEKHPNFYTKEYDMITGNPECRNFEDYVLPDEENVVEFHDEIHNVKGFFAIEFHEYTKNGGTLPGKESSSKQKAFYMILHLKKGSPMNCDEYLRLLHKYQGTIRDKDDHIDLYMVKIMGQIYTEGKQQDSDNHEIRIYSGLKSARNERYEKYMKTFFSTERDRLWRYLSNVEYHPDKFSKFGQEARCNLLIHGPPGTGKSTFVYRLAMALGRHIVSVDITAISKNRTEVYQIMQRPFINDYECHPNEFIVLLEEFDITVKYLNKKNSKPEIEEFLTKLQKKGSDENIFPAMYSRSTREFELEDLLEILQGPVPIKGSIIIATTNKFDEIRDICPALFRPGRLTPVRFDYMKWSSLQELSEFYFGHRLDFGPINGIEIPTSEIVEIALNASLYDNGFENFSSTLRDKLRIKNNPSL